MAFLSAQWQDLILLNYVVPESSVRPYLPAGCQIDSENGQTYASLVLFEFRETAVLGIKWPGHVNFSEINLRLYVTYQDGDELKRGVVFVRELVPKPLIALIANVLYKEPYTAVPIQREVVATPTGPQITYEWGRQHAVSVASHDEWYMPAADGHEAFIIEHYWGYTPLSDSRTNEYRVTHPTWRVTAVDVTTLAVDFGQQYGSQWAFLNHAAPYSAFMAQGSAVTVGSKRTIRV